MRSTRWNGWGDPLIERPLAASSLAYLQQQLGVAAPTQDASLDSVCAQIAATRLPLHPRLLCDAETRLRYSFGQSLPDWLRLRFGVIEGVADGVWMAESEEDVRAALQFAQQCNAIVIPHGGGSSVCGHLQTPQGDRPVLMLAMSRMCRLREMRKQDQLALFEAGISGPQLEAALLPHGYTLGHFPQSFEYSTLGGWIATRSSGQQSHLYGRIEQLFAGGRLITAENNLDVRPFPASAAGPDLREWIMGSEGRSGVITQAWMRVTPRPAREDFHALFFRNWRDARAAAQTLAQSSLRYSMLRVSSARETETMLALAGHAKTMGYLQRYLALRGAGKSRCMMLLGISGSRDECTQIYRDARRLLQPFSPIASGPWIGAAWAQGRYRNVYLRNTLWQLGYAIDTVETACHWSQTDALMHAVESAAVNALLPQGERVHAYTHLSHVYASGSSVYSTFVWKLAPDFASNMQRWLQLKTAVSQAIVAQGGTITHQHGVGRDLRAYLAAEKDAASLAAVQAFLDCCDPQGLFDSGNLLETCDV